MIKNYIKAARLRTLPLSISGIVVGAFLANFSVPLIQGIEFDGLLDVDFLNEKNYLIFWLAILTTIGFQVLSNFANDYGDGVKGTDDNREGEARMVSSGAITPKQMKIAMIVTGAITLVIALLLIYVSFGEDNFLY